LKKLLQLIQAVPREPNSAVPPGATSNQLEMLQKRVPFPVPPELLDWLGICNGPVVGPGGLFGIGNVAKHVSIDEILALYPNWKERKWLPVAGDGCGNYYVLVCSAEFGKGNPVVFVDTGVDSRRPQFVVASGLFRFLEQLLLKELGKSGWPFSREHVMTTDPEIARFWRAGFPWES
jgi:hypothetical protein